MKEATTAKATKKAETTEHCAIVNLTAALNAAVEARDNEATRRLRDLVLVATEHLMQEAHERNLRVEDLCPCYTDDVVPALTFLSGINAPVLHKCASPECPGYSFKASDAPHPFSTCGDRARQDTGEAASLKQDARTEGGRS